MPKDKTAPKEKTSIILKFKPKKETKGTFVFDEVVDGSDRPIVGTLYVLKTALPKGQPAGLTVKITPTDGDDE
jgi:hypothetical protein